MKILKEKLYIYRELKIFIAAHEDLINQNRFEDLYDSLMGLIPTSVPSGTVGQFTSLLLESDINPLNYLDYVPRYFLCFSDIKSFNLPDYIKSIEDTAFCGCRHLVDINIPNGVTSIGSSAFNTCVNIKDITIPKSVKSIGDRAFYFCNNLTIKYDGTKEDWDKIEGSKDIDQEVVFLRG